MLQRRLLVSIAPIAALLLSAAAPANKPGDELLVPRIRAHFDSVLVELQARDVSMLSPAQRTKRSELVGTLKKYRDRGVFPHNYDFPGELVPYFVDSRTGTLCAVAHLLESSGRRDIVNRVAAVNNNVWVPQLAGDAEFESWLRESGLTLTEAARIQVPYDFGRGPQDAVAVSASRTSNATVYVAAGAAGVSALNIFTNRDGHGRIRNWAGIASGVAGITLGTYALSNGSQNIVAGGLNAGLGVISTAVSVQALMNRAQLAERRRTDASRVAVAPILPTSENGAGLSLNVRF